MKLQARQELAPIESMFKGQVPEKLPPASNPNTTGKSRNKLQQDPFATARVDKGFAFGKAGDNKDLRNTLHTIGQSPKLETKVNFDLGKMQGMQG